MFEGIVYIEGRPSGARIIQPISVELNHMFRQNLLKTLDDVKREMNKLTVAAGGNCIVDFKYGQKSSFWKSMFGMDDILWYGNGMIAQI
jgi:hypothetical protein